MSNVVVRDLTKKYGDHLVFSDLNCTFESGVITGLLGNNGEGKTTILNLITNRIFPTGGSVLIDGETVLENDKALSKIFFMSEKTLDKEDGKIKDLLRRTKYLYPELDLAYADILMERFGLDKKKKFNKLSTGYRSIMKIVLALSCNAPVLAFDEPVLGLDANHRDMFYKELLKQYTERKMTVILSTHIIEEVADLIENVVILDSGKIMVETSAEELKQNYYVVSGNAAAVDQYVIGRHPIYTEELSGFKSVTLEGQPDETCNIDGLQFNKSELQKLFINLTNGGKD